jgi:hypothetical protein
MTIGNDHRSRTNSINFFKDMEIKKGDVYDFMLLWQEVENFKKKYKIIDIPFFFSEGKVVLNMR